MLVYLFDQPICQLFGIRPGHPKASKGQQSGTAGEDFPTGHMPFLSIKQQCQSTEGT